MFSMKNCQVAIALPSKARPAIPGASVDVTVDRLAVSSASDAMLMDVKCLFPLSTMQHGSIDGYSAICSELAPLALTQATMYADLDSLNFSRNP